MGKKFYTVERNVQMLIFLLKEKGIKRIIASPGTTNITFVYSVQQDAFFDVYSAPDERSAAYMACGMAASTGEPVVLSCTGATASRNYYPGLTEAFYRHLPVLAVTSTQPRDRYGDMSPQFIDRRFVPLDIVKESFYSPSVHCIEDEMNNVVILNRAVNLLLNVEPGPVHINLETEYKQDFSIKDLPNCRVINYYSDSDCLPEIPNDSRIAIFVGAHVEWSNSLTQAIDSFCEKYNAVVLCDWSSNYHGKYGVYASLLTYQERCAPEWQEYDLIIDIGRVSGAYMRLKPKKVWRICTDGKHEDRFRKLVSVFAMTELSFFEYYQKHISFDKSLQLFTQLKNEYHRVLLNMEELPFSNIYAAKKIIPLIPENSIVHLGILNSLRSWNFFEPAVNSINGYCNTGGFGIDGCLSALIGSSIVCPKQLHFGVIGDLAFFYDMNSLGNRHIGNNIRLMVVTNGCGTEFKNYDHLAYSFGVEADSYIAARGHYGNSSPTLIKEYANALGFKYLSARNKEEFSFGLKEYLDDEYCRSSIIFEIFVNPESESNALKTLRQSNGKRWRPIAVTYGCESRIEIVKNRELVEFSTNIDANSIVWKYKEKQTDLWKEFVNGNTISMRKTIDSKYDHLTIIAETIDVDGNCLTSDAIILLVE